MMKIAIPYLSFAKNAIPKAVTVTSAMMPKKAQWQLAVACSAAELTTWPMSAGITVRLTTNAVPREAPVCSKVETMALPCVISGWAAN